ncbi:hypothetical protein AC579_850 [Pseudocercospora musae]|uniref:Major facilitator superfamily (MFS) profile domain-containing protein n=1 Tax=Pseudocercospora musae TaxID=113226 RepID=A0A139HU69_9PEZI|nr:hypothetical protein AC579_850 [Pseudocercospora musae]
MNSLVFAAGLRTEQKQADTRFQEPPSSVPTHPRGPSIEELDAIELGDIGRLTTSKHHDKSFPAGPECPAQTRKPCWSGSEAPQTPNDLGVSQPSTPKRDTATGILPTFSNPPMNRWRVLYCCVAYFANGMSDSAPGAIIPHIEDWYHIGYAIVSLIWIANAIGFILSAFFNDPIVDKLGRAKSLMLSASLMCAAYVIIACAPPFPVVVVAYLIMGFGNAMNLALNNVFCANLSGSTVLLGLAQGSYGIGGIVAPIAATAMVSNGISWARFYLITMSIQVVCFFFAGWSFGGYEKEPQAAFTSNLQQIASNHAENAGSTKLRMLGKALKNRTTLIGALFIFAYQGAEVSESGWFISYLINYRHGDPVKVGYVTSGFWSGITVGRFTLVWLAQKVGERRFVFATILGTIIFQLMSWLIPSIVGNAVSVAFVGLLLGPIYPCAQTIFSRLLPGNLQVIAIGFISSAGSSGGAVVPFLTGLIAQASGTWVLHPVCIAGYVVMTICWVFLPRVKKPTD